MKKIALLLLLFVALATAPRASDAQAPVYVTLWFDTEDYILPQDDDATKRLAETLSQLGVRATFKIVGEKARVLERRGRTDVIAALRRHDIGYHSNTHSQQPTIAVYLQHAGWDDGRAEFMRREAQGFRDVERILGVTPVAYGQPGSAWAPQVYPALRELGVKVYLDEADHVGIDDQPFYYGGMLNVFKMRSNLARMELNGGSSLADGEARFSKVQAALHARGGGTISIYYHPNEWVQTEFWDAVNFRRGANPPASEWKRPGTRPAAETEQAFADFAQYVRYIKSQPDVRFVTASDLASVYADAAAARSFSRNDLLDIARTAGGEITFRTFEGYSLSPADQFALLTDAGAALAGGTPVTEVTLSSLDGPARAFGSSMTTAQARATRYTWQAFASTVLDVSSYCRTRRRIPDEIWIGTESMPPADYLATLAGVVESALSSGRLPADVERRTGRFSADRYVAEDSTDLWNWIIFPEGFHAPRLMEIARLQAWTLKPALLRRQ